MKMNFTAQFKQARSRENSSSLPGTSTFRFITPSALPAGLHRCHDRETSLGLLTCIGAFNFTAVVQVDYPLQPELKLSVAIETQVSQDTPVIIENTQFLFN